MRVLRLKMKFGLPSKKVGKFVHCRDLVRRSALREDKPNDGSEDKLQTEADMASSCK